MKKEQEKIPQILLVDDEPAILFVLEYLLAKEGYLIQKASNSAEALETLKTFVPDVAILDVMMPGIDGFELAKIIRQNPLCENVQIVFLTTKGTKKDRQTGYSSGGEVYIIKPFDNDDLLLTIKDLLKYG